MAEEIGTKITQIGQINANLLSKRERKQIISKRDKSPAVDKQPGLIYTLLFSKFILIQPTNIYNKTLSLAHPLSLLIGKFP